MTGSMEINFKLGDLVKTTNEWIPEGEIIGSHYKNNEKVFTVSCVRLNGKLAKMVKDLQEQEGIIFVWRHANIDLRASELTKIEKLS
jgi:hypothetical protein